MKSESLSYAFHCEMICYSLFEKHLLPINFWKLIWNVFHRRMPLSNPRVRRKSYATKMISREQMLSSISATQLGSTLKSTGVATDSQEMSMEIQNGLTPQFGSVTAPLDAFGGNSELYSLYIVDRGLVHEEEPHNFVWERSASSFNGNNLQRSFFA